MPTQRIAQLQRFHEEDPHDPFNIYALALEYMSTDKARTLELFEKLLSHHKDYLPTYYHAARYFQDEGHTDKAAQIFEQGIALAERLKDQKAIRELKSAYDEMMFE